MEAVRSLVQNPSQKHSIRHGAKQAVVRLELDSGEIIEWVRTEKTAYYRLFRPEDGGEGAGEPEEYRKIGLTVPEDVRALLRLGLVETEADDIDIHIGNQREPIFLLNRPGSQAAGFFAASSEAAYLLHMRQALKSREDYAKSTRKVLAGEGQAQEQALLRYQPLDGIGPELDRAEADLCVDRRQPEVAAGIGGMHRHPGGERAGPERASPKGRAPPGAGGSSSPHGYCRSYRPAPALGPDERKGRGGRGPGGGAGASDGPAAPGGNELPGAAHRPNVCHRRGAARAPPGKGGPGGPGRAAGNP